MPSLHATTSAPWQSGASLHGTPLAFPWQSGVTLHSLGGTYTPPPAPPGSTPGVPSTAPRYLIADRSTYRVAHAMTVTDLRDGAALQVDSLTMSNDEDALFWSLSMSGGPALLAKLLDGEQPSSVQVTLDGQVWRFLVDSANRSRAFAEETVQVRGRSLASAAGRPYEYEKTWSIDGDTTAAQIAASANILTEMNVIWGLVDWPVPDRVFSFFGTPLQVVKRVAESVGAMVLSDRRDYAVRVLPRYSLLPNEWSTAAPDVEIALAALSTEAVERADRPAYDGVYVLGQQQGAAAFVRLAGTNGLNQHPLVTDLLLTDAAACAQRAAAVLGSGGQQQRHTISLPVLTGAGEPGVLDVGWLARVVEPAGPTWYGMVRSVSVSARLPDVEQTVVLERHTKPILGTIEGTALPTPLTFTGPIADQSVGLGESFSLNLAPYWSAGVPPYQWSIRSGAVPDWVTFDRASGLLSGTAPGVASVTPAQFRATDDISSTADSNVFQLNVVAPAGWVARGTARNYNGIACSADGTRVVVCVYDEGDPWYGAEYLYVSTDSGVTWTQRGPANYWSAVASSADGMKMLAVPYGSETVVSTDGGVTWTNTSLVCSGTGCASSTDGTKLAVCSSGGPIYTSTDSGANWTSRATSRAWSGIASSADGTKLVAVVQSAGRIYTSTDSGANWTARGPTADWQNVASSADGVKLVASASSSYVYVSNDSGVTWTAAALATARGWTGAASSADGTKMMSFIGGTDSGIYVSIDSGATWNVQESARNWNDGAMSASGSKRFAIEFGGQIYTWGV